MIDKLEVAYMSFLRIIHRHNGTGYEEKVNEENLDLWMVTEAEQKWSL